MTDTIIRSTACFDYDLNDTNEVTARIRKAAFRAMRDHKRTGDPIVEGKNGEIVWTAAEDIVVPDEDEIEATTR